MYIYINVSHCLYIHICKYQYIYAREYLYIYILYTYKYMYIDTYIYTLSTGTRRQTAALRVAAAAACIAGSIGAGGPWCRVGWYRLYLPHISKPPEKYKRDSGMVLDHICQIFSTFLCCIYFGVATLKWENGHQHRSPDNIYREISYLIL